VASEIGRSVEGDALVAALEQRMRSVHETLKAAKVPRPRVAVFEWLDPLFVAGHWTPELVRRAGGIDVLAEPGAHSVPIDIEVVQAAKPDMILFAPCGFDVERAERESRALLAASDWRWARDARCWALDGNALTSRPGPRLVDAIETMAAIFARDLFPAPAPRYARLVRGATD
jgi:iron complex transport system substrate-binding protein